MSLPSDLVSAKIRQAKARGEFERSPMSDEAAVLRSIEALLERLRSAPAEDAEGLRRRLRRHEQTLGDILDRTGQGVLADALWDVLPSFDEVG